MNVKSLYLGKVGVINIDVHKFISGLANLYSGEGFRSGETGQDGLPTARGGSGGGGTMTVPNTPKHLRKSYIGGLSNLFPRRNSIDLLESTAVSGLHGHPLTPASNSPLDDRGHIPHVLQHHREHLYGTMRDSASPGAYDEMLDKQLTSRSAISFIIAAKL